MEVEESVFGRTSGKRREGKRQTSWWNERTVKAVKEKNEAWRKWWKSKIGEDKEDYVITKRWCRRVEEKLITFEEFTQWLDFYIIFD